MTWLDKAFFRYTAQKLESYLGIRKGEKHGNGEGNYQGRGLHCFGLL